MIKTRPSLRDMPKKELRELKDHLDKLSDQEIITPNQATQLAEVKALLRGIADDVRSSGIRW